MTKYFCDKCGQLIESSVGYIELTKFDIERIRLQCCDICFNKLLKFVKTLGEKAYGK